MHLVTSKGPPPTKYVPKEQVVLLVSRNEINISVWLHNYSLGQKVERQHRNASSDRLGGLNIKLPPLKLH